MNVCILKMLYFNRIDKSGRIDVNKRSRSKIVIFVIIDIFQFMVLSFNQIS